MATNAVKIGIVGAASALLGTRFIEAAYASGTGALRP